MSQPTAGHERPTFHSRVRLNRAARERLLAMGAVLLWLLLWEISVPIGLLDGRFFQTPSSILWHFLA